MENTIRYKLVNGKKKPLCDHNGDCNNIAFREVYPGLGEKREFSGWCYLCKKHFKIELKKLKGKLANCKIN